MRIIRRSLTNDIPNWKAFLSNFSSSRRGEFFTKPLINDQQLDNAAIVPVGSAVAVDAVAVDAVAVAQQQQQQCTPYSCFCCAKAPTATATATAGERFGNSFFSKKMFTAEVQLALASLSAYVDLHIKSACLQPFLYILFNNTGWFSKKDCEKYDS